MNLPKNWLFIALALTLTAGLGSQTYAQSQSQSSKKGEQTLTATESLEVEPINIMAAPPDDDFLDEFALPTNASKKLTKAHDKLAKELSRLATLTEEIEKASEALNQETADLKSTLTLRAMLRQYEKQLIFIGKKQESFRDQLAADEDGKFDHLPMGPVITEAELNELD